MSTKAEQWRKRFQKPQFSPADTNTLNLHSKTSTPESVFENLCFRSERETDENENTLLSLLYLTEAKAKSWKY